MSFVGESRPQRPFIRIAEERDRANAKLACGANDANGNLATIRDQ
jgi:hypothetical protein